MSFLFNLSLLLFSLCSRSAISNHLLSNPKERLLLILKKIVCLNLLIEKKLKFFLQKTAGTNKPKSWNVEILTIYWLGSSMVTLWPLEIHIRKAEMFLYPNKCLGLLQQQKTGFLKHSDSFKNCKQITEFLLMKKINWTKVVAIKFEIWFTYFFGARRLNLYDKISHVGKVNFVGKLENGIDRPSHVGWIAPASLLTDLLNSLQNFVAARRHWLLNS